MPNLGIWFGIVLLSASPLGHAATERKAEPKPVKAPEQPSAILLEFIGDWETDERQLIGMEIKSQKVAQQQKSKEVPHAP